MRVRERWLFLFEREDAVSNLTRSVHFGIGVSLFYILVIYISYDFPYYP